MKPVPPVRAYKILTKSDLSDESAIRLVTILKRGSVESGIAIMKSLRWSIDRALKKRRHPKLKRRINEASIHYYWLCDEREFETPKTT